MSRARLEPADYVVRDGTTIHVRTPDDRDIERLHAMWHRLSSTTIHRRFAGALKLTDDWCRRLLGLDDPDRTITRVATTGRGDDERLVAVAQLVVLDDEPGTAEFAALVEDSEQQRGIGTVLLRELAAIALDMGIDRLVGDVLADNVRMLHVLRDLGLDVEQRLDGMQVRTAFDVHPTERYLSTIAANEREAAGHALQRFLRPRRIAVVGASRNPSSLGGLVFRNLIEGEFAGPVYPVNPKADAVHSVAAYPTLADCPSVPDLVFVCLPPELVLDVVDQAGDLGVKAVCVISAGFAECGPAGHERQLELVERAHAHGIRLVGPNCMGIASGVDDVRMNGTFSLAFPPAGRSSFLSQSGALGLSVLQRFADLGLGLADFVSVGNTADIAGEDVMLFWEQDPHTEVILLYLESVTNARRFGPIARRIGRTKPVVAVKAGRTAAGQRAASSHTAALAAGDVAVEALFRQAGVVRTDTLDELFGVASLLATQAVPAGRRVAVITNGGGPGILAADAAEANHLDIPTLSDGVQQQLREFLPEAAATANPVDMIASCTAVDYRRAIEVVGASGEVDALVVIFIPPFVTRTHDVARAVAAARGAVPVDVPLVGVFMGSPRPPAAIAEAAIPNFEFPEDAMRALGRVAAHGEWRGRPAGSVVRPREVDADAVRGVVGRVLAEQPDGRWLTSEETKTVLEAYGVTLARLAVVSTGEEAAKAQADIGAPVAVKLAAPVHKRDVGGVVLDLDTPEATAEAVHRIEQELEQQGRTDLAGRYLVQEMVDDGVEVVVGISSDPSFGPLVMVGLGGTLVELLRDVSVRMTPLTDVDVDDMLGELRTAPLLTGYRGSEPVDVAALRDLLFRISALAEDHPELAEMDLNPVFVRPRGVSAVDARIRVAPQP